MWKIESNRNKRIVGEVDETRIEGWMQNFANRVGIGYDHERHVAIDPDGKRWVQLGYILIPEKEWEK